MPIQKNVLKSGPGLDFFPSPTTPGDGLISIPHVYGTSACEKLSTDFVG